MPERGHLDAVLLFVRSCLERENTFGFLAQIPSPQPSFHEPENIQHSTSNNQHPMQGRRNCIISGGSVKNKRRIKDDYIPRAVAKSAQLGYAFPDDEVE
jgi:hypothetical protein